MLRAIQKTTSFIVLAVAVLAAVGLIFQLNYAFEREMQKVFAGVGESVKRPEKPVIDTSLWLRYENKKYGFSFQYPPELKVFSCSARGALLCVNIGEKNEAFQDNGFAIRLYALAGLKPSEEEKFVTEEIGGTVWRVNRDTVQYFRTEYPAGMELRAFANKPFETISAILSTFKIGDNFSWKVYRNKQHGFLIEYPAAWAMREVDNGAIFSSSRKDVLSVSRELADSALHLLCVEGEDTRCDNLKIRGGLMAVMQFGMSGFVNAEIKKQDGTFIDFYQKNPSDEESAILRKILSTFQLVQ